MAVVLSEFWRQDGGLYVSSRIGIVLMMVSMYVIVFSAHWWTEAKALATPGTPPHRTQRPRTNPTGIHAPLSNRDIDASIRFASISLVIALFTEVLR
jgi:hypothetical protein